MHAQLPKTQPVCIKLPKIDGIKSPSGQVKELVKPLYGLRQAPKLWYAFLAKKVFQIDIRRSLVNDFLFVRKGSNLVYIIANVDDLLMCGPDLAVSEVKAGLVQLITVTDLGEYKHFLVIKNEGNPEENFLSLKAYNNQIIEKACMENAKPVNTLLTLGHHLYDKRVPLTKKETDEMS